MSNVELAINILRAKKQITALEKDVLDTWDKLTQFPFDSAAAKRQIQSNTINHPDVDALVNAKPTTILKRPEEITDMDLRYILQSQLEFLITKEGLGVQ